MKKSNDRLEVEITEVKQKNSLIEAELARIANSIQTFTDEISRLKESNDRLVNEIIKNKQKNSHIEAENISSLNQIPMVLQLQQCSDLSTSIKCLECQRTKTGNCCRFQQFRKLRYVEKLCDCHFIDCDWVCGISFRPTKAGYESAGFADPTKDPNEDDNKVWMLGMSKPPKHLNTIQASYILEKLAPEFLKLSSQEQMAKSIHLSEGR